MEIEKFEKEKWLGRVVWPKRDAHKGQNGRVLVIGGSSLFHAAPFWAANAASRIVDMVHFSSPYLLNNKLVEEKAKRGFWNGIVVPWEKVEKYIEEDEVVLIGPGMLRRKAKQYRVASSMYHGKKGVVDFGADNTRGIVGYLLKKYPDKKWVVDGGALQEVEAEWLNERMIVTPNRKELGILCWKVIGGCGEGVPTSSGSSPSARSGRDDKSGLESVPDLSKLVEEAGVTVVAKGATDYVCGDQDSGFRIQDLKQARFKKVRCVEIEGGHPGMTKGGTGDVLAGIIAGLYAKNEAMVAAAVGSWLNKRIGEKLGKEQVFFNASDMIGLVSSTYT